MLIVSGTITLDPSGTEQALELIRPLVAATLAEDGCLTYGFWTDPDRPGVLHVYEEWESDEAMGAHMASAHMAEFLVGMGSLPITGTALNQHRVSESSKLM